MLLPTCKNSFLKLLVCKQTVYLAGNDEDEYDYMSGRLPHTPTQNGGDELEEYVPYEPQVNSTV